MPGRIRLGGLAGFGDFLKVNPAFGWHRSSHTFGGHPGLQQQSAHAPEGPPARPLIRPVRPASRPQGPEVAARAGRGSDTRSLGPFPSLGAGMSCFSNTARRLPDFRPTVEMEAWAGADAPTAPGPAEIGEANMTMTTLASVATTHARRGGARRPTLEGLEARQLLYATTGTAWSLDDRITFSFVPDGTSVGGTPEQPLPHPQRGRQRAELAGRDRPGRGRLAADHRRQPRPGQRRRRGDRLGPRPAGRPQPRRHPHRRGPRQPEHPGLRLSLPPPANGGDLAGDIVFNTTEPWTTNGSTYDLETVAIHELGHALGLGHSTITSAVQYVNYNGSKQR